MEKSYYTIKEICDKLDLKPHVIRYWETEFTRLKRNSKRGSTAVYTPKELELIKQIKELICVRKFTLEGAKAEIKKRRHEQKNAKNNVVSDANIEKKSISMNIREELIAIKNILLRGVQT